MTRFPERPERVASTPTRERWLLSYADFVTLLLALFVVLYASARADSERHQSLSIGLQSAFGLMESPADAEALALQRANTAHDETPSETGGSLAPLKQLTARVAERLERERQQSDHDLGVSLHSTERGLVISLAAAEYFPAGGAEIPAEKKKLLAAIGPLLAAESGALHFEGHADDVPVGKGPYPSNWELSSARAAAVARYFIAEHDVDPQRVVTTGYASTRPVAEGDFPAERARNRRVEIVVMADGELVPRAQKPGETRRELGRLLQHLPPLRWETDESPAQASQTTSRASLSSLPAHRR